MSNKKHRGINPQIRSMIVVTRMVLGVGVHELVDATGISHSAINRIEAGEADPYLSTLEDLLAGLGLRLVVMPMGSEAESALEVALTKVVDALDYLGYVRTLATKSPVELTVEREQASVALRVLREVG